MKDGYKKFLSRTALAVTFLTGVSFFIPGQPQAKAQDASFNNIPAPDEKGPYNVGIRTILNVSLFDNVLMKTINIPKIQVFYPTLDPPNYDTEDPTKCLTKYTVQDAAPGVVPGSYELSSPLCAVKDASVAAEEFPLVVYDHGGGGLGTDRFMLEQVPLNELLATHGFVIVSYPHPAIAVDRVRGMSLIITYILGLSTTPGDPLFGRIDSLKIGISGLSTGGRTSLAVAGGWASPPGFPPSPPAPPLILPDPRVKAMVLYEPGRDNLLSEVATISIPYLIMGGNRIVNATVTVPEVFDATVLASPRIRVFNPEALHSEYLTNLCSSIEQTREAALQADPGQAEPLINMVPFTPCQIDPNTGLCRKVCNSSMRIAAFRACFNWNLGEINSILPLSFGFGGGRNFCNRVGVNSSRSLDTDPAPNGDGFTDSFLGDIPLFEPNDVWNSNASTLAPTMPAEVLVPMVKLYTVAFWKKFLEGDGRYMRYLTPGYANTHNLEAVVEIRE